MDQTRGAAELDRWLQTRGHGAARSLALEIGVSERALSAWRTGAKVPSYPVRVLLAGAAGIPIGAWAEKTGGES